MDAKRRTRVAQIMTRRPVTLREHDPVHLGGLTLLRHGLSAAPVVDDDGQLIGVLSGSDLLARFAAPRQRRGPIARLDDRHARAESIGQACSRPAVTTSPEATVGTAARELLDGDIGQLIVVDDGRIVGVLNRNDLLKLFLGDVDEAETAGRPRLSYMGPD